MNISGNSFRKDILDNIIRIYDQKGLCVIANIIDSWVYPNAYIELESEDSCPVFIKTDYIENISISLGLNALIEEINEKFTELTILVKYLKDNGYITFSTETLKISYIGGGPTKYFEDEVEKKVNYVRYQFPDKEMVKYLFKISKLKIRPTDMLIDYVNKGYRTVEERKADNEIKRQKRNDLLTLWTVIITAIGTLLTNGVSIYISSQVQEFELKNKEIKINSNCCPEKYWLTIPFDTTKIRNIFFEFDKADIIPPSTYELAKVVELLRSNSICSIVIEAYTDSIGTLSYNVELSNKRADTIKSYLMEKGIPTSRIKCEGRGESKPPASWEHKFRRW